MLTLTFQPSGTPGPPGERRFDGQQVAGPGFGMVTSQARQNLGPAVPRKDFAHAPDRGVLEILIQAGEALPLSEERHDVQSELKRSGLDPDADIGYAAGHAQPYGNVSL